MRRQQASRPKKGDNSLEEKVDLIQRTLDKEAQEKIARLERIYRRD